MNKNYQLIKRACLNFGILFFITIPIVWISLFFSTYQGDLTRIGKWMEADFGWQEPQAVIDPKFLISSNISEADTLVIGDSFSENLHWQSVLTQSGQKVATLTWSQISNICEDFPKQLKASGFKGKTLVIESIERIADRQLKSSANCKIGKPIPPNTSRTSNPLPENINLIPQFSIQGQFIAGLETIFHTVAIRLNTAYINIYNFKSKGTKIYPIENGCNYFSNRLCQFGLFFHEDYEQPVLDAQSIQYLETTNKRLNLYQVIWVIVPNKSSIYQRNRSEQFWVDLNKKKLGPNLYSIMQNKKSDIKDMYAPNDTHLSITGYTLLGNEIKKWGNHP